MRLIVTEKAREIVVGGLVVKAGAEFDAPYDEAVVLKALGLAVEQPPPPLPPAPRPRGRPPGSPNRPKPVEPAVEVIEPMVELEPGSAVVDDEPHVMQPEAVVSADAGVIRAADTEPEVGEEKPSPSNNWNRHYTRRDLKAEE